jgi:hypothetical protein
MVTNMNTKVNTKILGVLAVTLMLLVPTVAMAVSTFTVNYNVQTTSFTVEITAPGQTSMNFTGGPSATGLTPDGTSLGTVAWGKINNTGDTVLNFNISAPTNTGVTLRVGSSSAMTDNVTVTSVPANPTGWATIAGGNSANIFAKADFAAAVKGSTTVTIGAQ